MQAGGACLEGSSNNQRRLSLSRASFENLGNHDLEWSAMWNEHASWSGPDSVAQSTVKRPLWTPAQFPWSPHGAQGEQRAEVHALKPVSHSSYPSHPSQPLTSLPAIPSIPLNIPSKIHHQ